MSFPFKDPLFHAQWLRSAGHAPAGGAELGECLAVAAAIREPDLESWRDAWMAMADRIAREAEASLAGGHEISAHGGFLRASNYYRTAYVFLIAPGGGARLVEGYRLQRRMFEQAAAARPGWAERIVIPYEGASLRGYFFAAEGAGPRPTLIMNGGYDSTAEETFFYSGAAALARGVNVVCFDGPGQGAALIEDGLPFRPDWEAVIGAVLAHLRRRVEVDPARIVLMGMSFGGYLAPRAASGAPSLAALIADPGQYSLLEETRTRLPQFLARQLPDGRPFMLETLDAILRLRMRHPTKGWALRRGLFVHGLERPIDYLRLTAQYTLEGRVERIQCPTLIASAENDEIGATARKLYDLLACPKSFVRFSAAEGAGAHCESGARALFNQRVFDWLDGVVGAKRSAALAA
jgi:pimeloyl-ACP methyl ester carboxylesterase